MKSKIVISLTGHRPNRLDGYNIHGSTFYKELYQQLNTCIESLLNKFKIVECHSGMAQGADTVWAYSILYMKRKYPDRILFIADVPFTQQSDNWSLEARKTYTSLLKMADNVIVYSKTYTGRGCLMARNRGMINVADILIAVWDKNPTGGTYATINMAKKKNIPIHVITPNSIQIKIKGDSINGS